MSEENKTTNATNTENSDNKQQNNSTGGIKGFFKKVRASLEKFDKKMDEILSKEDFDEESKKQDNPDTKE